MICMGTHWMFDVGCSFACLCMKWEIFHRTHFDYAAPVRESSNELRLQPLSNEQQTVIHFS